MDRLGFPDLAAECWFWELFDGFSNALAFVSGAYSSPEEVASMAVLSRAAFCRKAACNSSTAGESSLGKSANNS